MTNRFVNPLPQFLNSSGVPYSGAQLFFYVTGTSTKLNTYSDSSLTIPNSNPVILDSAGRLPNAVFLQTLQYKVVLAPSTDTDPPTSPIWTQDPVYTSDYSTAAKFFSGSGSPNGSVAGTAGSATILADSYWDFTNKILYICTTTGSASTAVWTAINASTAAAVVPQPQGRLTLTSGTPVINSNVSAATAVYYTPYVGNLCPIYNGSTMIPTAFTELTLALNSAHVAGNIYDVFMFSNSGVPTLVTGPSWSAGTGGSITAGSCARGTGTGGAALSYLNGILTNTVAITGRNGSTTYSINANLATYLGSIYIDATNGQVSCLIGYGQNRKWGVWNAYNRVQIYMKAGDSTATWTYNLAAFRASNNTPSSYSAAFYNAGSGTAVNGAVTFCGLAEEIYTIRADQAATGTAQLGGSKAGIGINSVTVSSGFNGRIGVGTGGGTNDQWMSGTYQAAPSLGINNITLLEYGQTSGSGDTFAGTEASSVLTVVYRA